MKTYRAIIVEDDRSWQQILSEILTDAGLEVDIVDNLEDVHQVLRESTHRIAIVDLSLGSRNVQNRDGLLVLEAVKLHDPHCVAIMLTGYATVELAVSVLTEKGAFSCLRKETFNRAAFGELIKQALASTPPEEFGPQPGRVGAWNPAEKAQVPPAAREEGTPGFSLVVDDDAGWRNILTELLIDAGYRVAGCGSYGEALGWLRREKIDLAVVDLSLTGFKMEFQIESDMDGYRLLASTHERGIATIVVSGVASPEVIERSYARYGIFAHLEKQSFSRQAFLKTVELVKMTRGSSSELKSLTEREMQVLELIARGMTNNEIGETLVISANTVKRHLKAIYKKLDVKTRSAAAAKAISSGLSIG